MKKVIGIMAVVLMGMGMVSCENDSAVEDQALYEALDEEATDGSGTKSDPRK